MELVLARNAQNQITVTCDGQPSHTFFLADLFPEQEDDQIVLTDPIETGARLFAALFAKGTPALAGWTAHPKRILLVAENPELDAIPWEYLYGPEGYIVRDAAFVRGLPNAQRQPAPDLTGTSLHIVAIPSNPIARDLDRLDIAGEWVRLKESLRDIQNAIRVERVRPPTLEQARHLVANEHNRVVHFMGHGGDNSTDSFLIFEDERGARKDVTAQDFIRRMEDSVFLVTLNACVSATPGVTEFSNLARALTERGVPYALGMRFSIPDGDAKDFSQTFYSELARGSSVENAVRQARNSLADSKNPWAVGNPVLYTSLNEAVKGFETPQGVPRIDEHQPPLEVSVLPRAEGPSQNDTFQGRVDELLALGQALTGEPRAKLLTIHGSGGQGKTALAREAAERFAYAWLGGVWAVSLERNAALDRFTLELARLFKINLDSIYKQVASASPNLEGDVFQEHVQQELERRILASLSTQRALLVLDNAETFVDAVDAKDKAAIDLAVFLREKILSTQASLLLTSRNHLGWTGEQAIELAGLSPDEGARLFWQSAPGRSLNAIGPLAQDISRKVEGHPLSLRLLGGAFDASKIPLNEFVRQVETTLLQAEDKYKPDDHRHRTLYASIETSVRYLDDAERALLSKLWIFQSPFLSGVANQIFAPPGLSEAEAKRYWQAISKALYTLFRRGLLVREVETISDSNWFFYRTLSTVRWFAQHYLEQAQPIESLQAQMGKAYTAVMEGIYEQIDNQELASTLAVRCRGDLETCASWVGSSGRGWYANCLGWILQRTGDRQAGLRWLEQGLAIVQGIDHALEFDILNNMAGIYRDTGEPGKALKLFEQALPIAHMVGNQANEAVILNNMGMVYQHTGNPSKALEVYKRALPIRRAVGDRAGEAITLNNMGEVYRTTGQPDEALELYQQALPMHREVGNRAMESTTLNNMAVAYRAIGESGKALEMHKQALLLSRAVGDQAGEAITLNNIAVLYRTAGEPSKALELYEQALPILRAVGDRAGEAITLSNIGEIYRTTGQPGKALEIYKQALPIDRAVGNRVSEGGTLNSMAAVYYDTGQPDKALELFEQALFIQREVGDQASEAGICANIAFLLYSTGQEKQAVEFLRQAVVLEKKVRNPDYSQHAERLAQWEAAIARGESLPSRLSPKVRELSSDDVQTIAANTLAVLTDVPEKRTEWREIISQELQNAQADNEQVDLEFFAAILALLDGKIPVLNHQYPYAEIVQAIMDDAGLK